MIRVVIAPLLIKNTWMMRLQKWEEEDWIKPQRIIGTYKRQMRRLRTKLKQTPVIPLSKTDATNTYLSKTSAASTYAPTGASYTKVESDTKYARKGLGGSGLSASGFTMTGDIDMGNNKILKLADPITPKSATNKEYVDNNFLSKHGGLLLGNVAMSGQSITNLNLTPQNNNDAVTKGYVDNQTELSGGLSLSGITMQGDIDMNGNEISGLVDPIMMIWLRAKDLWKVFFWILLVVLWLET